MLQTGTLYLPANNENAVEINRPLPNIFLYFSRNGDRVITTKTDEQGKFSFDLPIGSYQVTMSLGPGSQILPLCAGALFELKSNSAQNAFEKWVLSSIYIKPEENPFVIMLQEIAQQAKNSAVSAKESAESAEKTAKDFNENTVGSGKVMREGAYGVGGSSFIYGDGRRFHEPRNEGGGLYNWGTDVKIAYGSGISIQDRNLTINIAVGITDQNVYVYRYFNEKEVSYRLYGSGNTTVDSNGFIKAASPIINLFADRIEPNDHFSQKYEKEPVFEKLDIGVYKISNTKGLAKGEYPGDWNVEIPKDINGERYFNTEWQQLEDDTVIIRTYEREAFTEEYQRYDEEGNVLTDPHGNPLKFYKRHEINGDPVDIKEGRFIALRFLEDEEAKAKREADAIKAQEEFEEQERLKRELEEQEKTELEKHLEENNAVLL